MRIKPYRALRPAPELVDQVASVPYDVCDREEARRLAAGNPHSFLHVIRSEIDLADDVNPYTSMVYDSAAATLQRFEREGTLVRDERSSYYVYRQVMGDHVQRGVVACCHVDDYNDDLIRKHELTRPEKETDRTRHIAAVRAQCGPVFLMYRDEVAVDTAVAAIEAEAPLYDFVAPDDVRHTLWRAAAPEALAAAFADVPLLYIADGHHRSASAARAAMECREINAAHTGDEEYNWFSTVLFPASQLKLLAYNRCVADLNGLGTAEFLVAAERAFSVRPDGPPAPEAANRVGMYVGGRWYELSWAPDAGADPVAGLDVSVLQERLVRPILGVDDPRTSDRIAFVGGIRGCDYLAELVDSGRAAVAFSMYPTSVEQIMAISDAGQIMPPKSTWFEPKLRSGLFVHTF